MELSRQINELVTRFVEQVAELARELAHAQLAGALGDVDDVLGRNGARPPWTSSTPSAPGGRRTPEQIERLRARLLAHIQAHPGQRIEEIKVALDATTSQLAVPLQKLMFGDLVRSEGERRGTRYYPAGILDPAALAQKTP